MPADIAPAAAVRERLDVAVHFVETAGYRSLAIAGMARPHWIASHVLSGEVETATAGETARARAGDVMVHPPDLAFSERAAGPGVHQWFQFELWSADPHVELLRRHPVPLVVRPPSADAYAEAFRRLADAWEDAPSPVRDLRVAAAAVELVAQILDGWRRAGSPPRPDSLRTARDRFGEVLAFMAARLGERLTRDDLARRVHLHPGYFDRAFRAAHGTSPMRMLRDLRLRRAQQLLETTDDTLDAIARACGLNDAAYLGRVFRERFGASPGQYRAGVKSTSGSYIAPLSPPPRDPYNGGTETQGKGAERTR